MYFTTWVAKVVFLVVICKTHVVLSTNDTSIALCEKLYQNGVDSYLENRFQDCVENIEQSLKEYHSYTKKLQNCRLKCAEEAALANPLYPVNVDDLLFYEKAIRNTLCIIKCRKNDKQLRETPALSKENEKLFEDKKPYEYLHLCYFKANFIQKAASAAFTYLVSHPKDEAMLSNLKYYSSMSEVNMQEITNLEAKDYVYFYIHGSDAYDKKDWKSVEQNMEESLISYIQSEEECRALCEGPFDQGWYPDFKPSIANHFTFSLRCKRMCREKLNTLNGEKHDDLLASHYHFLQYAYFKSGNLKAACEAAISYLLFYPDDDTMLSNIEYYRKLPKVQDAYFTPRPEALHYIQRQTYEERIFRFVMTEFKFEDDSTPLKEVASEDKPDSIDHQNINL